MTTTTNHKLIEEIERWWDDFQAADHLGECLENSQHGYRILRDNRQAILAALHASDANEADAEIMKLVRACHKTGFVCSNRSGRFGEDDCGQCDACKLSAALASQSLSAGEGGKV